MRFSTVSPGKSFDDFYAEWYPRALAAARRRGLRDPEATASDIMLMFFEKDYVDRYDPTRDGAVTFESWVNSMIYKRLSNAHRDEMRRPQTTQLVMEEADAPGPEETPAVEFKMMAHQVFDLLRDRYGSELADVWVAVVKQVVEDSVASSGRVRLWLVARNLRIGPAKASERMNELRRVIASDSELREMLDVGSWASAAA